MRTEIDVDFAQAESWNEELHQRMRWLRTNRPVFWSEKTQGGTPEGPDGVFKYLDKWRRSGKFKGLEFR